MSQNISPLKLSADAHSALKTKIRTALRGGSDGRIFFRHVTRVLPNGSPVSIARMTGPTASEPMSSLVGVSQSEMDRHIQADYTSFYGFVNTRAVRDEPREIAGKGVCFHSTSYRQFDMTRTGSLEFSDDAKLNRPTTPIVGDLLCIYMRNDTLRSTTSSGHNSRADAWFIASEQYLRAWTAVMHDWHQTFDKLVPRKATPANREASLRKKLFSGNRLMTNAWLKNKLALGATGGAMTPEESAECYWHQRTEYASKRWVDCWAAIVLMVRYGELPCPSNIPNNLDGPVLKATRRVSWDLPTGFMDGMITADADSIINSDGWLPYSRADETISFVADMARTRSDRIDESIRATTDIGPPLDAARLMDTLMKSQAPPPCSWADRAKAATTPAPAPAPAPTYTPTHVFTARLPPLDATQKSLRIVLDFVIPEGGKWGDYEIDDLAP